MWLAGTDGLRRRSLGCAAALSIVRHDARPPQFLVVASHLPVQQPQDLIGRLLERKPARRLGMLNGRAGDIKKHKWFEGLDWEAMAARRVQPPRVPQDDAAKRMRELAVSSGTSAQW